MNRWIRSLKMKTSAALCYKLCAPLTDLRELAIPNAAANGIHHQRQGTVTQRDSIWAWTILRLGMLFLAIGPGAWLWADESPNEETWPSGGRAVHVPVVRDTWVSSVDGERDANLGGAKRLKTKGIQEFTLMDIDPAPLRGRVVRGATLHLHTASKEIQHRLTVSTLASDWVEGTSPRYSVQNGSASFNWAAQRTRPWAYQGSDITAVMNGRGHTIWRFAQATPPDKNGWQTVAVEPAVIAARIAGISHGWVVFDDVGSQYTRQGDRFEYHLFPNRFIDSREAGAKVAPYLTVYLGEVDDQPPAPIGLLSSNTDGLAAGEAVVQWATPRDNGPAGTIGFDVKISKGTFFHWDRADDVPRYLIPMATEPGATVTMRLRDIGLRPGSKVTIGVRAIDAAGNAGPVTTSHVEVAADINTQQIHNAPVPAQPFTDPASREAVMIPGDKHNVEVFVVDPLDTVHPQTGQLTPARPESYRQANHLWSAKKKLIRLHAAKNEFVAFQVVLTGQTKGVHASVTLDGDEFDAPKISLMRFRNVKVKNSYLPDPLVPLDGPIRIPASDEPVTDQTHASFLTELYVPHDARAGVYTATLRLSRGDQALAIKIQLHVWDFTLPDHLSFIPQMNCYGLPGPPVERAYYRLAHKHRTCLNRLAYNWRGQVRSEHAPRWSKYQPDWGRYDRRFGPLFDGSAFDDLPRKSVPIEAFYLPINENWPMDIHRDFKGSYWADQAFEPRYRKQLIEACRQFAQHYRENGWNETFFEFYLNNKITFKKKNWRAGSAPWMLDEPVNTQDFWALRWYGRAFHEAVSPIRGKVKLAFRCDISRPQWQRDLLDGLLDVNVVSGALYRYHRAVTENSNRWQQLTYMYGGTNPIGTPNAQSTAWCIDAWCMGIDGVIPWQTVGTNESWMRGDTVSLFYPGRSVGLKGAVPSTRLKAYRRGQQDVEYLTILTQTLDLPRWVIGQQVKAFLGLKPTIHKTGEQDAGRVGYDTIDPIRLWELRTRVGAMLHSAKPPTKRRWVELRTPARDTASIPDLGYVTVGPPRH